MPWQEASVMDQRREFVRLAMQEGANRREFCRRFGISPDAAYKWIRRWTTGDEELVDRSRGPHGSLGRSEAMMEQRVLAVRECASGMGGAQDLEDDGIMPSALSTVLNFFNGRFAIYLIGSHCQRPCRQ